MNSIRIAIVALALLDLAGVAHAAESVSDSASPAAVENGIPITRLIAAVSKKTGKKFVIDPRVRANVELVGQDAAGVSYNELLTILGVYDFVATESGGYVVVLPDANVRRLEAIIEALDVGEPFKPEKCEYSPGASK